MKRKTGLSDTQPIQRLSWGRRLFGLILLIALIGLAVVAGSAARVFSNLASLPTPTPTITPTPTTPPTPTLTPTPLPQYDPRVVQSTIRRNTSDVRVFKVEILSHATVLHYDLKPWPLVRNETIADEVAYKVVCALRRRFKIPYALKLVGHGHFMNALGRKFTSPSVEIQLSASAANSVVCGGRSPHDINWRHIADRYKSYPIPDGAKVIYDY